MAAYGAGGYLQFGAVAGDGRHIRLSCQSFVQRAESLPTAVATIYPAAFRTQSATLAEPAKIVDGSGPSPATQVSQARCVQFGIQASFSFFTGIQESLRRMPGFVFGLE